MTGKKFFQHPFSNKKIFSTSIFQWPKKNFLQGIIGFRRAILADTPQLKGASFAPEQQTNASPACYILLRL
jgi:hypothetical protein